MAELVGDALAPCQCIHTEENSCAVLEGSEQEEAHKAGDHKGGDHKAEKGRL